LACGRLAGAECRRANTAGMVAKVVGLALLGVIAGALLWMAAEQHYQGCVEARMATALANGRVTNSQREAGTFGFDGDEPTSIAYAPARVQLRACSRWPF
jgi:hypothetical protein